MTDRQEPLPAPGLAAVRVAIAVIALAAASILLAFPRTSVASVGGFATIDDHVEAAMEGSGIPGLAYAIVADGEVLHAAAFGTAGPAGRPMTVQTPVVIGSVGKSITALAIRQLIEAGRIDPTSPVTRYLPWFSLGGPDGAADRVTIQDLLGHTSGFSTADGQDPRWYAPGRTPEDIVRGLAAITASASPGTYAYSNLNYVVLGVVVEAVSGQPYGEYLRSHVFEPLGMTGSSASLDARTVAMVAAQGHRYLFGVPVPWNEPYPTGMVPAGYQVSTAADMARYVAALANGGVAGGVSVVTPGRQPAAASAYGTDWRTGVPADAIVGQSGSTLTTNADILVMPGRRSGVVVLLDANPTQLLGLPAGAADIALDVLRLSFDAGPGASAPTVRTVYVVVDAILVTLMAAFFVHAFRARTWRRRYRSARHRRLVARTIVADLVLPVAVLIGVPLVVGSTGSSPAGDVAAGWAFLLWTLPDVAAVLIALSLGALGLGSVKLVWARVDGRRRGPSATPAAAAA